MQLIDLIRIRPLDSNSMVHASYASGRSANRRDSGGEFALLYQTYTTRSPCALAAHLVLRLVVLRSGYVPAIQPRFIRMMICP